MRNCAFGEGIHQPYHAGRYQVLNVYVLRQPLVDAASEKAHDRQMIEQQPFLLAGKRRERHSGRRILGPRSAPARRSLISKRTRRRFDPHCRLLESISNALPIRPRLSAPFPLDASGSRQESLRPRLPPAATVPAPVSA
jgi:hypothetical protein